MTPLTKPRLYWRRLRQQLWFRPAVWSLLAVASMAVAYSADRWRDEPWAPPLASGVVDQLLRIMATSMLAVSTFALSVLVNAFASSGDSGTPRATQLVVASPEAQKPVAVFLASFIFSIVGVIALGVGQWGAEARFVLFLFVLSMLCWVIYAFMQYIHVLTRIGRVGHTIESVERAARDALLAQARKPMGGARQTSAPREDSEPLKSHDMGYLQLVDYDALEHACEEHGRVVHVEAHAGDFVHLESVLFHVHPTEPQEDFEREARKAFVIGRSRTIEQDATYGLIVLAEIAQRALSPAVNDPGTAIAVVATQTWLILEAVREEPERKENGLEHVSVAVTDPSGLIELAFDPIARSGASIVEVQHQLMGRLRAIADGSPEPIAEGARRQALLCLERARESDMHSSDLARIQADFDQHFGSRTTSE